MDDDTKEVFAVMGGCALLAALFIVGTAWGVISALKWAFT